MYKAAAKTTVSRMAGNEPVFEGPFYIRALTTFENECFEDELHVFSRLLFVSRRNLFTFKSVKSVDRMSHDVQSSWNMERLGKCHSR